jgi:hypothetical protein
MTIQEAYNKGLTDAEEVVIYKLTDVIKNIETEPFNNPELEKIRMAIKTQMEYIYSIANSKKSNIAKFAQIEIDKSLTFLEPVIK